MARSPTQKQRKAIKAMIESGGTATIAEVMRKAGYSENTIHTPSGLTRSEAWKQFAELAGLSWEPQKLIDWIWEGAQATRTISAISGNEANGKTVDFVDVPDYDVRHKYISTILKVQDAFPSEKHELLGKDGGPIQVITHVPDPHDRTEVPAPTETA